MIVTVLPAIPPVICVLAEPTLRVTFPLVLDAVAPPASILAISVSPVTPDKSTVISAPLPEKILVAVKPFARPVAVIVVE